MMAERITFSESLYADCYPIVQRVVRAALGADSEQGDVLQNAFIQIFLGIGTVQDPERLNAWVKAVARNTVRREIRRRRRRKWVLSDPFESSELLGYEPDYDACQRHEVMRRTLSSMPSDERDVLSLWLAGAGTIAEIASQLGCSHSTASRRLRAARRRLAKVHARRFDHISRVTHGLATACP
jgi:RNA polymerase sigma-70 factor (ECF subfamily)